VAIRQTVNNPQRAISAIKSCVRFDLTGIPPARRGVPQIEVSFDIDANGILNVSAKDKGTGREQKIVIKASSGLSEEEIQRMIKGAAEHQREDAELYELVALRNRADNLIYSTRKSLDALRDRLTADERQRIEEAIRTLETKVKGSDRAAIEAAIDDLSRASVNLASRVYRK
jgi:molecular chaperone DnaK